MNMQATLSETHPIQKVPGDRYTRCVLIKFQAEFSQSNNCIHETLNKDTYGGGYQLGRVEEDRRK